MRTDAEFRHICRYNPAKAAEDHWRLKHICEKLAAERDWLIEEFNKACKEVESLRATIKQLQGEKQ